MVSTKSHDDGKELDKFSSIEWLTDRAVEKHKEGKTEEAISFYLEVIELDENQPDWVYGNVITLLAKGSHLDKGLKLGEKALEIHPKSDEIYRALGMTYGRQDKVHKCIDCYKIAIDLEPKQPDWLFCNLAKTLLQANRFDEVINVCQQGISYNNKLYYLYFYLGESLREQERWDESISAYHRVQELNPNWIKVEEKLNLAIRQRNQSGLHAHNTTPELPGSEIQEQIEYDSHISNADIFSITKESDKLRLIAFFLPQFHPIPENDEWWGKGFTEWTNVTKAKPLFEGHYQPHLPADLGFYDLRLPEVREQQAQLARKYGVYGFCYYYYWFAGKRLLDKPLDDMLYSQQPDFPFCLCWANENWTRRWDGAEHDVLMAQEHSRENNHAFAKSLIPYLKDKRYIRIDEKPLIIVYRADALLDPKSTLEEWRKVFRASGVGEVYLCGALTFNLSDDDLHQIGFDSSVEFPPHQVPPKLADKEELGIPNHKGYIYDYQGVVNHMLATPLPKKNKRFLTVMTGWDNTARKGNASNVFINANPETYEIWLRGAVEKTLLRHKGDEQLVFVNAWNEWAEGTHLEPDRKYGHSYLSATSRAIHDNSSWKIIVKLIQKLCFENHEQADRILVDLKEKIDSFSQLLESEIKQTLYSKKQYLHIHNISFKNRSSNPTYLENPLVGSQIFLNNYLKLSGWSFDVEGKKITSIKALSNDKVIQEIQVDRERSDVYEIYKDFGIENLEINSKVGFVGDINVDEFVRQQKDHNILIYAVYEDKNMVEIASIDLNLFEEKEPKTLGRKIKSKISWYNYSKDEIKEIFTELQKISFKDPEFKEELEQIEDILTRWNSLNQYLVNFNH